MGAILTSPSISILITYIVKSTKMQKGRSSEMNLPLLENDITDSEPANCFSDM